MEWRKYKKQQKKITDHMFQKGVVLKMSKKNSEYINSMT